MVGHDVANVEARVRFPYSAPNMRLWPNWQRHSPEKGDIVRVRLSSSAPENGTGSRHGSIPSGDTCYALDMRVRLCKSKSPCFPRGDFGGSNY